MKARQSTVIQTETKLQDGLRAKILLFQIALRICEFALTIFRDRYSTCEFT